MKLIQYILILMALLPFALLRNEFTTSIKVFYRVGFFLLMAVYVFFVLFPELTTSFANFLGVGRGTDLLVYLNTFSVICLSVILIGKFEKLQTDLDGVVREIALIQAKKPQKRSGRRLRN